MNNVEDDISALEALAPHVRNVTNETVTTNPNTTFASVAFNNASATSVSLKSTEDSFFYIYVWAIAIVTCVALTTGR